MVFLGARTPQDSVLDLRGRGLRLRAPALADYGAWAELRAASRAHLVPWEPAWVRDELSRQAFRKRLRHYQREQREDLGYAFLLFSEEGETLMGGLTLTNVRRGVTQSAALGYWLGAPFAGQGRMTDAVRVLLPYAFGALRLHRVEAASMLANTPSIRVLERCGFAREGVARRYIQVNGAWRDHILFARVSDDPPCERAHDDEH